MSEPLVAAGVRFSGFGIEEAGYRVRRFNPKWHSLIYTIAGSGQLKVEGSDTVLEPGSLVVAPSRMPHAYRSFSSPWTLAWFCFDEINGLNFSPDKVECTTTRHKGLIIPLLEELTTWDALRNRINPSFIKRCIELLLIILRNDTETTRQSISMKQRQAVETAFLAVHQKPAYSWTVGSLLIVSKLSIGQDRFRQLCREFYGRSPMKQVRAIRMQIVRELLVATDYPLRVIAPMVGYGDEFSLSSAFRASEGCSPNHYRSCL